MSQTDQLDATPTEARDIALTFLDIQRRKQDDHRGQGEHLALTAGTFIRLARHHGAPWTDIAHALGTSTWAARRSARRKVR